MATLWSAGVNFKVGSPSAFKILVRKIDRTVTAGFAPNARIGCYFASLHGRIISTLESIDPLNTDTLRRDSISLLTAYHAATAGADYPSAVQIIERNYKDAKLLLAHLYGRWGSKGIQIDAPDATTLREFEALVAEERSSRSEGAIAGTSY